MRCRQFNHHGGVVIVVQFDHHGSRIDRTEHVHDDEHDGSTIDIDFVTAADLDRLRAVNNLKFHNVDLPEPDDHEHVANHVFHDFDQSQHFIDCPGAPRMWPCICSVL